MSKYVRPPANLRPKYQFGQQATVSSEFYGTFIGVIEDVAELETGFLFWKKRKLVYQVTGETDAAYITTFIEEDDIQPYQKLKPVK